MTNDVVRSCSARGLIKSKRRKARWANEQIVVGILRRIMFESGDDLTDTDVEGGDGTSIWSDKPVDDTWDRLRQDEDLMKIFRKCNEDKLLVGRRGGAAVGKLPESDVCLKGFHEMSKQQIRAKLSIRFRSMQKLITRGGFIECYMKQLEGLIRNFSSLSQQAFEENEEMRISEVLPTKRTDTTATGLLSESSTKAAPPTGAAKIYICKAQRYSRNRTQLTDSRHRSSSIDAAELATTKCYDDDDHSQPMAFTDNDGQTTTAAQPALFVECCDTKFIADFEEIRKGHPGSLMICGMNPLIRKLGHHLATVYNLHSSSHALRQKEEKQVAPMVAKCRAKQKLKLERKQRTGEPKIWVLEMVCGKTQKPSKPFVPPFWICDSLFSGRYQIETTTVNNENHHDPQNESMPGMPEKCDAKGVQTSTSLRGTQHHIPHNCETAKCCHCFLPLLIGPSGLQPEDAPRDDSTGEVFCSIPCKTLYIRQKRLQAAEFRQLGRT